MNRNDDCTVLRITAGQNEKEGGATTKGQGKIKETESEPGLLREMDPNIEGQRGMIVEKKTTGSWKRRARQQHRNDDKENVSNPDNCLPGMSGKRGFKLRDEENMQEEDTQIGKKSKIAREGISDFVIQVEEASHKWPQMDQ